MSDTGGNDAPAPRNSTGSIGDQFLGTIREELQGSSHVSIVDETSEHVEELESPKPTKKAKRKLRKTQSAAAPSQLSWRRGSHKPGAASRSPPRSKSSESLPRHDRSPARSRSKSPGSDSSERGTRIGTSARSYFSRATSTQSTHRAGSTDELLDLDDEDDFLNVKATTTVNTDSSSRRTSGPSNRRSFWKNKNRKETVDQSVNLMDAETGQYEQKTPRRGMGAGFRQKSLVDIFLSDDFAGSEHNRRSRGGLGDSLSSIDKESGGGVGKWLMLAFLVFLGVSAVLTIPSLGIVSSGGNNTPAPPTKPPTNPPTDPPKTEPPKTDPPKTDPPTDAPAPAPAPDDTTDSSSSGLFDMNLVLAKEKGGEALDKAVAFFKGAKKEGSRKETILSLVTDQDISDPADFEDSSSPASKALQWIASEDKAQLPLPGDDEAPDNAEQGLLQRYAMAVFYFSQQVESATGNEEGALRRRLEKATPEELANRQQFDALWTSERSICLWTGVTCNDHKMMTDLYLSESLLRGTIPQELFSGAAFPFLTILDLSYNKLEGTLPHAVWADSAIEFLYLQHNSIQGNIDSIATLEQLTYVDLSNNEFTGHIPAELGAKLQRLDALHLAMNNLDGKLPAELAALPQLAHLDLDENMFTGKIPEEWAALTELEVLTLSHCETVEGPIPEALENMRKLNHLSLTGTKVQGTIPAFLGALTQLNKLYLHRTEIEGAMPQEICDLRASSLQTLTSDCNEEIGRAHV